MFRAFPEPKCKLIAVSCGKFVNRQREERGDRPDYYFPTLISSGLLEVHRLINPTLEEFHEAQRSISPHILYFQGEQLENEEELGSLMWGTRDVSDPRLFSSLIGPSLPTTVYLEVPNGEEIGRTLHLKGIPYVIYWKDSFSSYAASHFGQALFSVIQSTCSHIWDVFQLAQASFRLYCVRNNCALPASYRGINCTLGPLILGDEPKVDITAPKNLDGEVDTKQSDFSPIKVHDTCVDLALLVCGRPCPLDACFLGPLEDGINAILNAEIRGCKLRNQVSAVPSNIEPKSNVHEVVTMQCNITTSSAVSFSLLVSGSKETCCNGQLLEGHIKNECIEKSHQKVRPPLVSEEKKRPCSEPQSSMSVAAGAPIVAVWMKAPQWVSKVLKYLASELCYRNLVSLGIACIDNVPVAAFEKEDADRLLFFCRRRQEQPVLAATVFRRIPPSNRSTSPATNVVRKRLKVALLRPIPSIRKSKEPTFPLISVTDDYGGTWGKVKSVIIQHPENNIRDESHDANMTIVSGLVPDSSVPAHSSGRESMSKTLESRQGVASVPSPVGKHGCKRSPMQFCSEEEFLNDLMQFLILRGHNWLIPLGGISMFPEAVTNGRQLDLYTLYKEVVSRGGFRVENGINWKGQVFPVMRNYTESNKMTGIANVLKRHYKTYLLEYEVAHDDVLLECCLLCNSITPGDWVNCCVCNKWIHFACDVRQHLGFFKDYAKAEGLDYTCPPCSEPEWKT